MADEFLITANTHRHTAPASIFAGIALLVLTSLALMAPVEKVAVSDCLTLLFLALCTLPLWHARLLAWLETQESAASFVMCAAMLTVDGMARRVAPENGPGIHLTDMPEYILPYSFYIAVLGAAFTMPLWWKTGSTWVRALGAAVIILSGLAGFSYWLLSRYYPSGVAAVLDPSPLPGLFLAMIEFTGIVLLCHVATLHAQTRRIALRVLPMLLLVLWARFQFSQPVEDAE